MITLPNLQGQRVLNTRPQQQANALNDIIEAAGGIAISVPLLNIEPIPSENWMTRLASLSTYDYALFTSHHAVTHFMHELQTKNKVWPLDIGVIAIGQATQQTLQQYGIPVQDLPIQADSEHLLALEALHDITDKTILLIKGEGGRTLIPETLSARGAQLTTINVYRRTLPLEQRQKLIDLWKTDGIDSFIFTSQEAMQNLFLLLPQEAHGWICHKPCFVISNRLAEAAKAMGIEITKIC